MTTVQLREKEQKRNNKLYRLRPYAKKNIRSLRRFWNKGLIAVLWKEDFLFIHEVETQSKYVISEDCFCHVSSPSLEVVT